nr:hypothetical protein CFP56_08141 [Quercus suber]
MAANHSYSHSSIVYPTSASSSSTADNNSSVTRSSTYLDYRSSIDTTPSRPISHHASSSRASLRSGSRQGLPLPSYMVNYRQENTNVASKAQPIAIPARVAAPAPVKPTVVRSGTVIIAIAAEPPTSTVFYLNVLLRRHTYAGVAIVGITEHAETIKQLKIDTYALAGRLKQELSITTHVHTDCEGDDVSTVLQQIVDRDGSDKLGAVLCAPEHDGMSSDLLSLDPSEVARSWQRSVGFVHTVARSSIPRMSGVGSSAVFAVLASTAHSPAALVNKAATNTLVRQLDTSYASSRGLAIGHAEQLLIPEPELEQDAAPQFDLLVCLFIRFEECITPRKRRPGDVPRVARRITYQRHQNGYLDQGAHSRRERFLASRTVHGHDDRNGKLEVVGCGGEGLRAAEFVPKTCTVHHVRCERETERDRTLVDCPTRLKIFPVCLWNRDGVGQKLT